MPVPLPTAVLSSIRRAIVPAAMALGRLRAHRWRGVRFLCYHSVGDDPEVAALARMTLAISTAGLRRHLDLFARAGYRVVSMADALALIASGRAGDGQFICLTFDDGRIDNFTRAWPVLRAQGHSAHFFVSAGHVGCQQPSAEDPSVVERFMDAETLKHLVLEGASIGSHGHSHPDLRAVSATALAAELAGSRRALEGMLGVPVTTFAYPFGYYDARVLEATAAAGYTHAFVVRAGTVRRDDATSRFTLPRNAVRSGFDAPENDAVISGGFDFARWYSALKALSG